MAFLLLAFIGFLTLIILIVHLVHGQDDINRSVNLYFIAGKIRAWVGWCLVSGPWSLVLFLNIIGIILLIRAHQGHLLYHLIYKQ